MYTLWWLDGRVNQFKRAPEFREMPGGPYPDRPSAAKAAGEFIAQGKLTSYIITPVGKTPLDPIGSGE